MDSRSNRYYSNVEEELPTSRSSRNKKLYKEVYGRFENNDNLPLEDNTDEIDMARLKELVLSKSRGNNEEIREHLNVLEQRKRNIDEQKVYDINKILEKAKYENDKLKENTSSIPKVNRQILSTLQSTELSLEEIKEASSRYGGLENTSKESTLVKDEVEEKLSMTRELKYQNLSKEVESVEEKDFSLDLFDDLKPMGNTITTKPIKDNEDINFTSSDTKDIDIIKKDDKIKNDFFTNSYEFSKKDFMQVDDDFSDLNKGSGILKIILLFLLIFILGGVIAYFILNYGIGVS